MHVSAHQMSASPSLIAQLDSEPHVVKSLWQHVRWHSHAESLLEGSGDLIQVIVTGGECHRHSLPVNCGFTLHLKFGWDVPSIDQSDRGIGPQISVPVRVIVLDIVDSLHVVRRIPEWLLLELESLADHVFDTGQLAAVGVRWSLFFRKRLYALAL